MFFWEQADPATGIVRDRARTDGAPVNRYRQHRLGGFGLSGLCIAAERGWVPRPTPSARARTTLRFFAEKMPHQRGWFFHFVNLRTGAREWKSELSSIDTALLLAGVLTTRRCFAADAGRRQIRRRASIDVWTFSWMLAGHPRSSPTAGGPNQAFWTRDGITTAS